LSKFGGIVDNKEDKRLKALRSQVLLLRENGLEKFILSESLGRRLLGRLQDLGQQDLEQQAPLSCVPPISLVVSTALRDALGLDGLRLTSCRAVRKRG